MVPVDGLGTRRTLARFASVRFFWGGFGRAASLDWRLVFSRYWLFIEVLPGWGRDIAAQAVRAWGRIVRSLRSTMADGQGFSAGGRGDWHGVCFSLQRTGRTEKLGGQVLVKRCGSIV